MSVTVRRVLAAFAMLGLGASTAASWVHYHLIQNPDYSSFCDVNSTISCKQAYLSSYGSLAGIPVAILGVVFFALILLLLQAAPPPDATRNPQAAPAAILLLSTVALGMVLYLAVASFLILKEVCPLCVATYVAVIGLFTVSVLSRPGLSNLIGGAARDLQRLVSSSAMTVMTSAFVIGAIVLVMRFPQPEVRPFVPPLQPLTAAERMELEGWFDVQPKVDLPLPPETAKVVIVKFNDYQCPPCRATYFAYEPIVAKYKDRPQDVKFILKHFPLNSQCNAGVHNVTHPAACDAAAAAVMAGQRGTFDKLTDWFFMHQNDLTPALVRSAADDVGGIKDFDALYPQAIQQVQADAAIGVKLGVGSTPTFFINGRKTEGLLPSALDALIDLELRRASHQP